ncbi:DUF5133 domain-containing protein [Streptomyces sp. NPDC020965]|uniref:DUF5133 domain-containing protein n=1 Tax=Streptomyces sp. NPDC020965 TaxID=3365105 RepID=UPI0037B9B37E
MLLAHPAVLRTLIGRYEALKLLKAHADSPHLRRRMDDLVYTLCVSTGTRDVDSALLAARRHEGRHPPRDHGG